MVKNVKSAPCTIKLVAACVLFLLALMHVACSSDPDPITVRIFSYGTDYSGTYVINEGGSELLPAGTNMGNNLYFGEFTLDDVDDVTVDVTSTGNVSSLGVRIYRDDVKVKDSVVLASSDPEKLTVSLTYAYDEESTSDDD